MKKSTTKMSLVASIAALVLCCAMLIGTTFAWFTDTASTAVNSIQAGKLDIALEMKVNDGWENAEGKMLSWVKAEGSEDEAVLWEPGCTYRLPELRIVNKGNLALKYKIRISGIVGDAELLEVISFTYGDGINIDAEVSLKPHQATEGFIIEGHMSESAGNEYQGLSIEGIAITVVATQDTVEHDSNNNTYDKNAEYPVIDANELKTALAAGGVVAINNNITADATKTEVADRITIAQPTTLNLNAKFIVPGELEPTYNWAGLYIAADTVLNATKNGGIQCLDKENGECGTYVAHITDGANVTVNGGTYYGGGTILNVQTGTLTINGGHFEVTPFGAPYNNNFLLNCIDANYQNGTAKIIIKGGTFVNFDPSNNSAEGAGTNFVAEGYTVVAEPHGEDIWYIVVPE